jgi:hypothetical protein
MINTQVPSNEEVDEHDVLRCSSEDPGDTRADALGNRRQAEHDRGRPKRIGD